MYQPTACGRYAVEIGEDQRIGEEDGVVEERLRDHQSEADQGALAVGHEQRAGDLAQRRVIAHAQPHLRPFVHGRSAAARKKLRFDAADDRVRRLREAVRHQPARAFRNPKSHDQNNESYCCADQERQPPADRRIDECRIEQDERTARAHCRAKPEAAVDEEVGPAAEPCRNKLLDCRIDGSVFAADAGAGEKAERDEAPRIPRQPRGRGRREINDEGDCEQLLAPEPIGQPAEEDRAEHCTGEITASGKADLRIAQSQSGGLLELAGKRAGQRHFETVENPGDAECDDHQQVKSPERQGVKPRRNIGGDDGARWARSGVVCRVPAHRRRDRMIMKVLMRQYVACEKCHI